MVAIELKGICKSFRAGKDVLRGLDLQVASGEILMLVGPSGSGKSTVLRIIAGLESPDEGAVYLDGRDITATSAGAREVAMVFQDHALYPHMTVAGNLGFGMKVRGRPRAEICESVQRIASHLSLSEEMLARYPSKLSGGERQRVALGRALARDSRVFLLDEPVASLDPSQRTSARERARDVLRSIRATAIYVTHDQGEAMMLGDRIAFLEKGKIQQCGAPQDLYDAPACLGVAKFLGSPPMQFFSGHLDQTTEKQWFVAGGIRLEINAPLDAPSHEVLTLGVRPEDIQIVAPEQGDTSCRVRDVRTVGAANVIEVECPSGERALVSAARETTPGIGADVGLSFNKARLLLFDRDSGEILSTEESSLSRKRLS